MTSTPAALPGAKSDNESVTLLDKEPAGAQSSQAALCRILVTYTSGAIVPATYVWGAAVIRPFSQLLGKLAELRYRWLLKCYNISIVLASLAFFPHMAYMLRIAAHLSEARRRWICALALAFFFFSSLWMPLCAMYLDEPTSVLFVCIRVDLALVAVSALAWTAVVWGVPEEQRKPAGALLSWIGCLGILYMALHCTLLDAMIWPFFFR
eukprot:CAMPEP_0178444020 /NCGR_PEP_ID=MMETSP0689_2-20121128/39248_1 /TAXON_ID=160604 /ORGANISM="Amphidinium massartii, Strain CS-259" /LENGTH=208 /DNA_ID=CAMNT_0020068151 /DNA_START=46 /DNA_END=668 /DNA_ORIENTATION=+